MRLIKREIVKELREHLQKPEITFLVGPRQAGKTTILRILENELKAQGKKTLFLNLDIEEDKMHFSSQSSLLKKIELEIGKEGFVFIDEIQRKEDAGVFLKGIYDMGLPYKFIVSGSGSVELKEKLHESLAGRKRLFEISTLSFEEFVNFKTDYRYETNLETFFDLEKAKTLSLVNEYLHFGGYPRVVLEDQLKEKRLTISEIYKSYVEKDITYLLRVARIEEFTTLVRILSFLSGRILNLTDLSSEAGISSKTVKQYLWYLQQTYIIDLITPFSTNRVKELTKAPMCYFTDLGLRNYAAGTFGNLTDFGFAFQNFVYLKLKRLSKEHDFTVHFWRTKDNAEVDFVLAKADKIIPVEVKYKSIEEPAATRSLQSFINRYNPEKAILVNIFERGTERIKYTTLELVPFYMLDKLIVGLFS
ncbi:MAG: ATP-binding protein [Fervidobacterium sp.]|uniref:ATP-binding protein n=1 Tax=Fervidobacterium sp. TaxID=1871331 RepID=UPI00404994C1